MTTTATIIQLDDHRVISVKRGPYLIGEFTTIRQVERALTDQGLSLADLEIIN